MTRFLVVSEGKEVITKEKFLEVVQLIEAKKGFMQSETAKQVKATVSRIFNIADEDRDGYITHEEALNLIRLVQGSEFDKDLEEEVADLIRLSDKNKDGVVNIDEAWITGLDWAEAKISARGIPQDQWSVIIDDLEEIANTFYAASHLSGLERMNQLREILLASFTLIDTDNSGFLEKGEIKSSMSQLIVRINTVLKIPEIDARVDEVLAKTDTNHDGKVSFDEMFKAAILYCADQLGLSNVSIADESSTATFFSKLDATKYFAVKKLAASFLITLESALNAEEVIGAPTTNEEEVTGVPI
jgi:Ca2+-binding EF-hand superfamily protein